MSQSQATNWTSGERRGKVFPVEVSPGTRCRYTPGGIQFHVDLTVKGDDEDEDGEPLPKRRLTITLSPEDVRALHEQISRDFLDMPSCEGRKKSGSCSSYVLGQGYQPCSVCKAKIEARDKLWAVFEEWNSGRGA